MNHSSASAQLTDDDKTRLRQDIPGLAIFGQVNQNFDLDALSAGAQAELAEIFYKEDGVRRREDAIQRRIDRKRIGIRSRTNQILMGVKFEEIGEKPPKNEVWAKNPRGDSTERFQGARRSIARTAQRLYTNRNDLQANCDDVRFIDMDPEMLNDNILRAFDLHEFLPAPNVTITAEQRLELYAQAIPHIRAMLHYIEPMQSFQSGIAKSRGGHFSKFKRGGEKGETEKATFEPKLHNFRMNVITKGANQNKLMIVREKPKRGQYTFQVMDLPSAARRLKHIGAQYKNKDLVQMREIPPLLVKLYELLNDKPWNEVKVDPVLDETLGAIDGFLGKIGNVQNEFKKDVRDALAYIRLTKSGEFKKRVADKTGKQNPEAAKAQLGALLGRLAEDDPFEGRALEVTGISGYLSEDDMIILNEQARHEKFYEDFQGFVERHHADKALKFMATPHVVEMRRTLAAHRTGLEKRQLSPYSSFARLMKTYFDTAEVSLARVEDQLAAQAAAKGGRPTLEKAVTDVKHASAFVHPDPKTGEEQMDGADMLARPRQDLVGAYVAAKAERMTSKLLEACEEAVLLQEYEGRYSFENLRKCIEEADELRTSKKVASQYFPREFNILWLKFKDIIQQTRVEAAKAEDIEDLEMRNTTLESIKENIKVHLAKQILPLIESIASFRDGASVDEDGNLYRDMVSFDLEHTGGWPDVAPALRGQTGRPLNARETAAKEATLGEQPCIIQIGAVKQRFGFDPAGGRIKKIGESHEFSCLVKPTKTITPNEAHRLSDEDLVDALPFEEHRKALGDFLQGAHGIIGHNVRVDLSLLLTELARAAGRPSDTKLKNLKLPEPTRFPRNLYDTADLGQRECQIPHPETGLYKFPGLKQLYTILFPGRTIEDEHTAIGDARATMQCYVELMRRNVARIGEPTFRVG